MRTKYETLIEMSLRQGSESRNSILPTASVGTFGSSYSPSDAMMSPAQLGIRVGNSMGDVVNAVKGVGFYIDQIGFGEPSTSLTNGMPLKPLGVNYFLKTGATCSNGADMWHYMEGIPTGDALGKGVQRAMADMGMPALRGLAPGMIEDAKNALNPAPLMNAMFGSGYPQCKQVTRQVGDAYNRIQDPSTGDYWITDPDTASFNGSQYTQTRWVQDTYSNGKPINMDREQWEKTEKAYNANGTPKTSSGFANYISRPKHMIVIGVLCLIAYGMLRRRRR
jgi:hypothetical protein